MAVYTKTSVKRLSRQINSTSDRYLLGPGEITVYFPRAITAAIPINTAHLYATKTPGISSPQVPALTEPKIDITQTAGR